MLCVGESPLGGVPLFPTGMVKQYDAPSHFMDMVDLTKFQFYKHTIQEKLRSAQHSSILFEPELKEILDFVEESAKDFLDSVIQMEYEEFFVTESWINISGKDGFQKIHNHSNSIISGTLYLKSEDGHPVLEFWKQRQEDTPFISLREHYINGNPNTARRLAFPCTEDTMLVFNSHLYHGHGENQLESERISLSWNGLVNFVEKDKNVYSIRFKH